MRCLPDGLLDCTRKQRRDVRGLLRGAGRDANGNRHAVDTEVTKLHSHTCQCTRDADCISICRLYCKRDRQPNKDNGELCIAAERLRHIFIYNNCHVFGFSHWLQRVQQRYAECVQQWKCDISHFKQHTFTNAFTYYHSFGRRFPEPYAGANAMPRRLHLHISWGRGRQCIKHPLSIWALLPSRNHQCLCIAAV